MTFDDERAARALELLKRVASDFQIIYLTTSDRYDSAADAVVELPGPTAVDDGVDGPGARCARGPRRRGRPRADRLNDTFPAESTTIVFALGAALAWGAADYGGGLVSRRTSVHGVVLGTQLVGLLLAVGLTLVRAEPFPGPEDLGWSLVAGVLGALGVTALYRGLAVGRMGIVAPITGVLAAVIPVVAGMLLEGVPPPLVLVGIVLAILAVLLVSRVADEGGGRAGLAEALVAGVAIGLFAIAISRLSDGHVFGPFVVVRATQAVLVTGLLVVTRAAWRPTSRAIPALVAIGILDMTGNSLYVLAVQAGALAVASVLASMYPVVTVLLAVAFLRERITRDHWVGIGLAAVAIACIGAGSRRLRAMPELPPASASRTSGSSRPPTHPTPPRRAARSGQNTSGASRSSRRQASTSRRGRSPTSLRRSSSCAPTTRPPPSTSCVATSTCATASGWSSGRVRSGG